MSTAVGSHVMPVISTKDLREKMGSICDRVRYTGQGVVVKRKNEELVAIVPVEVLKSLKQKKLNALNDLVKLLHEMRGEEDDRNMTDEKAMAIANAAVAEVRQKKRIKRRRK